MRVNCTGSEVSDVKEVWVQQRKRVTWEEQAAGGGVRRAEGRDAAGCGVGSAARLILPGESGRA